MDTTNKLAEVLQLAQRNGLAHNNGAGGQFLLCATEAQLLAFARALAATPSADQATQPAEAVALPDSAGYFKRDKRGLWVQVNSADWVLPGVFPLFTHPAPASASEHDPACKSGGKCLLRGKASAEFVAAHERASTSVAEAGEALSDERIIEIAKEMPMLPWGIGSRRQDALAFAKAVLAARPVADGEAALPPLPEKRRVMFCTKCGYSGPTAHPKADPAAPCERCDYFAFVSEVDYSEDEMRAYAIAALARQAPAPLSQAVPEGTWMLIAPDGRQFQGDSPLRCAKAELDTRVPAEVQVARIWAGVEEAREELTSPLAKRVIDLHEKASMPWHQAEELALSEFGFDEDDLNELIGEFDQCLEYLTSRERIEDFARHVLVFGPDYLPKAPLADILSRHPQPQAVDLTDEQWYDLASAHATADWNGPGFLDLIKAVGRAARAATNE